LPLVNRTLQFLHDTIGWPPVERYAMKTETTIRDFSFAWGRPAARALMARVLALLVPALLATFAWDTAAKDLDPVFTSHVTDSAAVLGAQAAAIDSRLKAFEAATGHQVIVLTVPTIGDRSIDEYAVEVFQKWKVGRAKIDDGVLFVIAVAERKMRIEVGYGLEGTLTDARCSRIIREIVAPQFAQGDYGVGIGAGVAAIIRTLAPPSALTPPDASSPAVAQAERDGGTALAPLIGFAIVMGSGLFIGSLWMGFFGLFIFSIFTLFLSVGAVPGSQGMQLAAAIIAVWLWARWFVIAGNVRKYHLARSTNHFFTWLRVFFAPGSGRPLQKGKRSFVTFNFSFGGSDSSASSSSDDSNCGGGGGGKSGGAGASGGW
jgi:uncharacterized protein